MNRLFKKYQLWLIYAAFLILAILFGGREAMLSFSGAYAAGKIGVFLVFGGFFVFSLYATKHENFFKTIFAMNRTLWGRQVGLDLYISVFLSLALIYMIEGSVVVMLFWAAPVLLFANLAILPYILLNFGAIIGHFAL